MVNLNIDVEYGCDEVSGCYVDDVIIYGCGVMIIIFGDGVD